MATFEQLCTLCLKVANDQLCEKMNHATWGILEVLLLKLNSDDGNVLCRDCLRMVTEAFNFKSMCLCTDKTIMSYVDNGTGHSVDLREVYEKRNNQPIGKLDDFKVCRLCMQLITVNFMSVHKVDVDVIDKYIPEINFSLVQNAIICTQCLDSLYSHGSFIKNCLVVVKKIKGCFDNNVPYSPPRMSLNSYKIENIKSEEIEGEERLIEIPLAITESKNEDIAIKTESIDIKSEDTDVEGDSCSDNFFEDTSKTDKRICNGSPTYERIFESSLNTPPCKSENMNSCRNDVKHEARMYKCDTCGYETKYKHSLKRHLLQHKDPCEVQMYKCDACSYETKFKFKMKDHLLVHKNPSEVPMFKCETCSYETKYKKSLTVHLLRHKDPSEIQMYKCNVCSYKTKFNSNMKEHLLVHKDPSEVQMYKCDTCSFETKYKKYLKVHQLQHKDASEVQMYKCDACSYETKYKCGLRKHLVMHKDPTDV